MATQNGRTGRQGGNWLCQDLWDHYQFTMDKAFLRDTAYPLMKGAATFCLDWLVENKDGYFSGCAVGISRK